ncbi:uncharacterized protein EI90DRAFT_2966067 [Cantharellus anzutake]|uniref:uncharacterized protein n=1 Tax=Cantharellus anzutake TaxID=1750568 RepID=UPI00190874B3|nr:uncharacterized protein EI90DRAFT_2966067 [Cantharellus anzutake]KAF8340291.1 hypothetical protein EI90DRAFT_2966067 [Cantharellus anzutake]
MNQTHHFQSVSPLGKQYWSSTIGKSPPSVDYEAVIGSEDAVLEWLENVHRYGFCLVNGVPVDPKLTEELIRRIAFIRETHYGGFWEFSPDLAHGDTAYTNMALKAHTDTTYFTDPCGLQIFHLLSHTEGSGGESLLVDGFRAASILQEKHPEDFEILMRTRVPTHAVGDALYKYTVIGEGYPIITTRGGEPSMIRYNNDDRSVIKHMAPEDVAPWYVYRALASWDRVLSSPDSEYWFQLQPGTVVVIDNHRVLHGRAEFTGKRRLCGAYVGKDDYLARLYALRDRAVAKEGESSVWDPTL